MKKHGNENLIPEKRERKKSMPEYENGKYDSWKREKKTFDARKWKLKYDYRIAFSD